MNDNFDRDVARMSLMSLGTVSAVDKVICAALNEPVSAARCTAGTRNRSD